MSHQTGITSSKDLLSVFADARDGHLRIVKVEIKEEQAVLHSSYPPQGDWKADYENMVPDNLDEKVPCYIFFRLDTKNSQGFEWIFIAYSPDNAHIRQKMLYAGTRATVKKEFSTNCKHELFGTSLDDVSYVGYLKHVTSLSAPAPLTAREEELQEIKKSEVRTEVAVDTKQQTLQGVAFPVSGEALDKLAELRDGALNYVQLSVDLSAETVELATFESTEVGQLPSRVPTDHARYHVFVFPHQHEGDYLRSIVFIYSMPGYKCSIKERMLYSSCKGPLVDSLQRQLGIEFDKKLEVDDASELTQQFLYDEIHPAKNVARQQFARPKGPAGRGPRRITKK